MFYMYSVQHSYQYFFIGRQISMHFVQSVFEYSVSVWSAWRYVKKKKEKKKSSGISSRGNCLNADGNKQGVLVPEHGTEVRVVDNELFFKRYS